MGSADRPRPSRPCARASNGSPTPPRGRDPAFALVTASRSATLAAALGFLALEPRAPELQLLHRCFDNWRGVGDVVTGMGRQGYQVSLGDHGAGQWIAVFYAGHGGQQPLEAAGTAQGPTPWAAVQRAARGALVKGESETSPLAPSGGSQPLVR